MLIRAAAPGDLPVIHAIYRHHVLNALGTFETEPPSVDEMQARFTHIAQLGFPYLVAEGDDGVCGYAYANHFRARTAYRHTVEDSIYVAADACGRGIGRALLTAVVDQCAALGLRQMLALIGDSGNAASIGVHRSCGFRHIGALQSVGLKFGRWVDVVIMQRELGAGSFTPPE